MAEYPCPHCKSPVYDDDALLCHFCGESLERAGSGFLGKIRYANHRVTWFFVLFAVLTVLSFLLFM